MSTNAASTNAASTNAASEYKGADEDEVRDQPPGSRPSAPPTELTPVEAHLARQLLSRTALGVFRLNGQFLAESERLARPAGLTAAWWQVLGAVLPEPQPVSGIARTMGITRQSVQRVADLLVREGLAEYLPNPAHRRAKLLAPTAEGRASIARIEPAHADLAGRLAAELGKEAFAETAAALERLTRAMERVMETEEAAG